jgi:hypothetical protein
MIGNGREWTRTIGTYRHVPLATSTIDAGCDATCSRRNLLAAQPAESRSPFERRVLNVGRTCAR